MSCCLPKKIRTDVKSYHANETSRKMTNRNSTFKIVNLLFTEILQKIYFKLKGKRPRLLSDEIIKYTINDA